MKAWPWMIVAVVAPALPMLLEVPEAFVSLAGDLGGDPETTGAQQAGAVAMTVPDPLTQWFTRVISSGLPIVAPAVAFLVPDRHRRRALLIAGVVLGVLALAAIAVTQTARTGDAFLAGVLAVAYAGSIAAAARAYRITAAETAAEQAP